MFDIVSELCELLPLQHKGKPVHRLVYKDCIFMTFVKLCHNSTLHDIGKKFGVEKSTASNIIHTYLPQIHKVVYRAMMDKIPPQKKIKNSLPPAFADFQNCRLAVDCTEIRCEVSANMTYQKLTYSSY